MKLDEMLLEFLQNEGYRPQVDPEDGEISFKSEGLTYAYFPDKDDEQFFRIMLPAIYSVNEENKYQVLEAIDKTNACMKVAKLFTVNDRSVWVSIELLLDSTPVMEDIVPRTIALLRHARQEFYSQLED